MMYDVCHLCDHDDHCTTDLLACVSIDCACARHPPSKRKLSGANAIGSEVIIRNVVLFSSRLPVLRQN